MAGKAVTSIDVGFIDPETPHINISVPEKCNAVRAWQLVCDFLGEYSNVD